MRTTVTVEPDVEQLLRQAMQQSGQSFKVTLNQAIRKGLADTVVDGEEPPFVVKPKAMGMMAGVDLTRLQVLADDLEIDSFLELTRKLQAASSGSSAT